MFLYTRSFNFWFTVISNHFKTSFSLLYFIPTEKGGTTCSFKILTMRPSILQRSDWYEYNMIFLNSSSIIENNFNIGEV